VKVWEPDDVRTFLMRCSRHRLGALSEIAVLTGLRRGELLRAALVGRGPGRQEDHRATQQGRWHTERHVFTMEDGRALDPSYVTRLHSNLRKVGGEELTIELPRLEALRRVADASR
jgi:hypothetical protein